MSKSDTIALPAMTLDWEQRRFSHCQASEDECTYEHCPRWRDGNIVNEAHCALDLIRRDADGEECAPRCPKCEPHNKGIGT